MENKNYSSYDNLSWQEYQNAVAELYRQIEGRGLVRENHFDSDSITGQQRQIDVWIETTVKGHTLKLLVDAKYRKGKLDVKTIEEVSALGLAVNANKCIIVTNLGFTNPARKKADY